MKKCPYLLFAGILMFCCSLQAVTWTPPVDVSSSGTLEWKAQIATSSDGSIAVTVWEHYGFPSATNTIQSSYSTDFGATWVQTDPLSPPDKHSFDPQVVMSSDGSKAVAVWENRIDKKIQAAYLLDSGTAWSSPINLSVSGNTDVGTPQVAMSSGGSNVVAVWWETHGDDLYYIKSAYSTDSGKTWLPATASLSSSGDTLENQIAMSSDGSKAVVVWRTSATGSIQAAYSSDSGVNWFEADTDVSSSDAERPQVAMSSDDGSKVVVVWRNYTTGAIQSAYSPDSGKSWTAADLSSSGDSYAPQVAMSSDGLNAVAVWGNDTTGTIQAACSTNFGAHWILVEPDLSPLEQSSSSPQLSMSLEGSKVVVVWQNETSGKNAIIQAANSANSGVTWSPSSATLSSLGSDSPQVAGSSNGLKAIVVWSQTQDPERIIQSARMLSLLPPSWAGGIKKQSSSGFQSYSFVKLQWHASTSAGVQEYRIYRDLKLVATVPSNQFEYKDAPVASGPIGYTITSVSDAGESDGVSVIVQ